MNTGDQIRKILLYHIERRGRINGEDEDLSKYGSSAVDIINQLVREGVVSTFLRERFSGEQKGTKYRVWELFNKNPYARASDHVMIRKAYDPGRPYYCCA